MAEHPKLPGLKRTRPSHQLVRVNDWECVCLGCGMTWFGEDDIHTPFREPIPLRDVEAGERRCYPTSHLDLLREQLTFLGVEDRLAERQVMV